MGYDISAFDKENKRSIAYMEAPANSFEKIKSKGYDWFALINASECDGIVSGLGIEKFIQLIDLKRAYKILLKMDDNNKFKNNISGPLIDPTGISKIMERSIQEKVNLGMLDKILLQHQMIQAQNKQAIYVIDELKDFMKQCIDWCEEKGKLGLMINFA